MVQSFIGRVTNIAFSISNECDDNRHVKGNVCQKDNSRMVQRQYISKEAKLTNI